MQIGLILLLFLLELNNIGQKNNGQEYHYYSRWSVFVYNSIEFPLGHKCARSLLWSGIQGLKVILFLGWKTLDYSGMISCLSILLRA